MNLQAFKVKDVGAKQGHKLLKSKADALKVQKKLCAWGHSFLKARTHASLSYPHVTLPPPPSLPGPL